MYLLWYSNRHLTGFPASRLMSHCSLSQFKTFTTFSQLLESYSEVVLYRDCFLIWTLKGTDLNFHFAHKLFLILYLYYLIGIPSPERCILLPFYIFPEHLFSFAGRWLNFSSIWLTYFILKDSDQVTLTLGDPPLCPVRLKKFYLGLMASYKLWEQHLAHSSSIGLFLKNLSRLYIFGR